MSDLDEVATELRRIVDRLNSAPLAKVEPLLPSCHEVAALLVERTRHLDPDMPAAVALPAVGATAAGAQLAVVGKDYLQAARATGDADVQNVLSRLTSLRRDLP